MFRFSDARYIPTGSMRMERLNAVIMPRTYNIEGEDEVFVLRVIPAFLSFWQWIRTWKSPFAVANWIHIVLVKYYPFDVFDLYISFYLGCY